MDFFEALNKFDKYVIYGAGGYALNFLQFIDKSKVLSIAVTRKDVSAPDYVCDIPVVNIDSLVADDSVLVIVAINESYHNEVESVLIEHGWKNIVYIDLEKMNIISQKIMVTNPLYKNILSTDNNDCSCFNDYKFCNLNKCHISYLDLMLIINDILINEKLPSELVPISEGPYEVKNVCLCEGDVVFDIGANIGLFSCVAASKKCRVYAFEPGEDLIEDIKKQAEIYNNTIIPVKTACSDFIGTASFGNNDYMHNITGALHTGEKINPEDITVPVTTIDAFVEENNIEHVDFIKADIEGAERDMLKGAVNTLKKFAPKLAICTYHLPDDKEVLERIVKEANPQYKVVHKWKKMYCWVEKETK